MAGFNEQTLFAAPDGEPFDNYYNAMNGTFVHLGHAVHLRWD